MNTPIILTDNSSLEEIYHLRVAAWEASEHSHFINSKLLPNGWKDDLDDAGIHWIITNDKMEIVASARLNIISNQKDIPHFKDFKYEDLSLPNRFAYLSRLVVKPHFRGAGYASLFDRARIQYALDNSIGVIVTTAAGHRIKTLLNYGFTKIFSFTNTIIPVNKEGILSSFMLLEVVNLNKILTT